MRLIDADSFLKKMMQTNRYFSVKFDILEEPTIDPETLPVVQQLRAELAEVKAERDALRQKKSYATSKFGNNSLTLYRHDEKELSKSKRVLMVEYKGLDCAVSFSESGEEGPFTSVMNIDRYGHLTIAREFANAILGPCESEMKVVKND